MTEKLYYRDAYISEFDARVLSAEEYNGMWRVVLDRTAFFPNEGGQSADTGRIGGVDVVDVREESGIIYHILKDRPDTDLVSCSIDFGARFEKMQCHTAEHILCGIIHRMYGYENVGFHLGDDVVTFDVDGELSAEQIDEIELLANRAVFENRKVTTAFPTPDELGDLEYRAKLELTENVRIVNIEGVDSCACCAPHVSYTGEIGLIKIVDFMRHRGGMRLFMQAGYRALCDYKARYSITRAIGALTSTPSLETLDAVKRIVDDNEKIKGELSLSAMRYASALADAIEPTDGNTVCFIEDATVDAMRELANRALPKVGGSVVVISGCDGSYRYVIASRTQNLRDAARSINSALSGKGGGRPEMITGTFSATLEAIREYFK